MNRSPGPVQQTGMNETRRIGETGSARVDGAGWWKPAVAGAALIAAVIVGARLGVDAWFVGFAAVILGVLLTTMGLVLGSVRLSTLRRPTAGS